MFVSTSLALEYALAPPSEELASTQSPAVSISWVKGAEFRYLWKFAGDILGGIIDLTSTVGVLPTALAILAVFLSAMQGVLALESVDPCRLSVRKMNFLLSLEFAEVVVSVTAEILSFVELRAALQTSMKWLQWVAPCLLAAGLLETAVNLYFTLAVLTKNRVGWVPFATAESSNKWWELLPFVLTATLSSILIGWRLRGWWKGVAVEDSAGKRAVFNEPVLQTEVMGFAVGWTVGITGLVFIVIMVTDFADDGANYFAGLRYLWKPESWLALQHGDIKVWYREVSGGNAVEQYVATAVLDANVSIPETERDVISELEKQPLHCGNAIVGTDRDCVHKEDRRALRLHKLILIAEHLVAMPLLFVMVIAVSRLHDKLSSKTFDAIRLLAEAVVVLALLEIAVGVKNVIWNMNGTAEIERGKSSSEERLEQLRRFRNQYSDSTAFPGDAASQSFHAKMV